MAGYKLQIMDSSKGFNFNSKYENLSKKSERPAIIAKTKEGNKIVKEKTLFQGEVIQGRTERRYIDDEGNTYVKDELTFWCDIEGQSIQTAEISQTKVFQITSYEPLEKYTDHYIISAYYELSPSTNDMKKDIDKDIAISTNLSQMYKLYKYLMEGNLIARAEFCPSSRGFITSDGYIRPICIDKNKWTLELGVFKEAKNFMHMNEGEPIQHIATELVTQKIRMI